MSNRFAPSNSDIPPRAAMADPAGLYDRGGVVGGVPVLAGIEVLNDYGDFLVFGAPEDCVAYREIFALQVDRSFRM